MTSDNLVFFTRRNHPQWETVEVKAAIKAAASSIEPLAEAKQITCHVDLPDEPLLTFGDTQWLTMAVSNLLANAMEHSPAGATITVRARQSGKLIEIQVSDQGPGIEPGIELKLFKPFYTTQSGAIGLGLANVRSIMERHGGGIRVGNHHQGGAVFSLILQSLQRQQAA